MPSIGGGWLAVVGWVVSRWGLFVVAEWWPRVTAYRTEPRAGAIFKLWVFWGGDLEEILNYFGWRKARVYGEFGTLF